MQESQINLYEILQKRDKMREKYKKMLTAQKLRNRFYEIWNEKYNK